MHKFLTDIVTLSNLHTYKACKLKSRQVKGMLMMLMPILFTPETNAITDLIAHVRYTFSLTYFITLCLSYLHPAVKLC